MSSKTADGVTKLLSNNLMLNDISSYEMYNPVSCSITKMKMYFYYIILALFSGNFNRELNFIHRTIGVLSI